MEQWQSVQRRLAELDGLLEMALQEGDSALAPDLEADLHALEEEVESLHLRQALRGPYDRRDAIVAVHAGLGGTDAHDWAEMLLRMYIRWGERRGFQVRLLDRSPGEEAGIKSATLEVCGPYAYGWLKGEKGTHRLVRLSPFDADRARHTSFALVEVLPEAEQTGDVVIRPEDLRIEAFRASGHGGQNVQKVASAVRITHLPTGITVTCQQERSQHQNREIAMRILRARLMALQERQRQEELARLKGEHIPPEFGTQIRSYVLHPYKLVKDHRTGYETADAEGVLDGDLDPFLKAYLAWSIGKGSAPVERR
ncbi:Peptide chain release factor 2 [bacterium HR23]|nr:Peptide chain release factor 2 [bacterium HR23]